MRPRTLLLLLVVANVLAFLWWHGDIASWSGSSREPDRLRQQVDADRLKVVPPAGRAVAAPSAGAAAAAPAGPAEVCVGIGPLEETRAARVRRFLIDAPAVRADIETLGDTAVWMVYTPPSDSLAIAQAKLAELRRQGVADLYLMPDGPYRLGISFGLFRAEDAARVLRDRLTDQGVRGVRVALRGASEPKSVFRLHLAGDDSSANRELAGRLAALQAELGVRSQPCDAVGARG